MASISNLEELPQLVMEKIASFLNHKQLLVLEQVSRKMKCIVDTYFSITDHLIIGYLPEVAKYNGYNHPARTDYEKKCLDGLLKTIKRCGIRLRTIQINVKDQFCSAVEKLWNCGMYLQYIFESAEVSDNCPYVENIIAYPNMDDITMIDTFMLRQQNVSFVSVYLIFTEIYAKNVKISKGESCKLRSISLFNPWLVTQKEHHSYERILHLYSNLEHMTVYDLGENLFKFLPQFIENGLKDLDILSTVNFKNAKKYCNIGKDLRTLRLRFLVGNDDDIAALNKLTLSKNIEIIIEILNDEPIENVFAEPIENVSSSIIACIHRDPFDCSLMTKLKNLQEFCIRSTEQLKVITEGSFPELKRIYVGNNLCLRDCFWDCDKHTCDPQILFPKLLTIKGNQLTFIETSTTFCISIHVVWKALKHCTAVKSIRFRRLYVDSPLPVTTEDMKAICDLSNLQQFVFSIPDRLEDDTCRQLRELMKGTVKEHTDFRFNYKYYVTTKEQKYFLGRIHF